MSRRHLATPFLRILAIIALVVGMAVLGTALPERALAAEAEASYANMYRLYNPWSGEHLYTASLDEAKSNVRLGWRWEGVGWVAPSEGDAVYRLYNPYSGDHHYTTSLDEYEYLGTIGWNQEGVSFHSDASQGVAVYREFNPYEQIGTHNYTTSADEDEYLGTIGWHREGIGWYGADVDPLPYDEDDVIDTEDAETLGETVARVAVACAGTADPDPAIRNTGANAPWSKVSDSRLDTWYSIADATLGEFGGNQAYSSCAQAVAGVLGATVDPDIAGDLSGKDSVSIPSRSPETVWSYIQEHGELYQKVTSADDIRPGDIICSSNHIAIYVGNEAAREKFPSTDATVFQASYPDRYPTLDNWPKEYVYSRFGGNVYHVVAKNANPSYPYIDYEAII